MVNNYICTMFIEFDEENEDTYEGVVIWSGGETKASFRSGDLIQDWSKARQYASMNYAHVLCSSSVDQFMMVSEKYDYNEETHDFFLISETCNSI